MDPDPYLDLNWDFWLDPNLDLHKKNADPQHNDVGTMCEILNSIIKRKIKKFLEVQKRPFYYPITLHFRSVQSATREGCPTCQWCSCLGLAILWRGVQTRRLLSEIASKEPPLLPHQGGQKSAPCWSDSFYSPSQPQQLRLAYLVPKVTVRLSFSACFGSECFCYCYDCGHPMQRWWRRTAWWSSKSWWRESLEFWLSLGFFLSEPMWVNLMALFVAWTDPIVMLGLGRGSWSSSL